MSASTGGSQGNFTPMTHRQRVLKTFRFEQTDRAPCDLMEGVLWGELSGWFKWKHGLGDDEQIHDFLDTDCRWMWPTYAGPHSDAAEEADQTEAEPVEQPPVERHALFSNSYARGPLTDATTVAEVEAHDFGDPSVWQLGDVAAFRDRWPDHARILVPGWTPLFWGACEAFGMEQALVNMATEPKLFEAFVAGRHERYMEILTRFLAAGRGVIDICWLGDDYAGQENMIADPALWRKLVKPYLAEQVRLAREHGMCVLFHSCGAVRSILADLIDIGVSGLLVFQTTARGMDAESIAREFGGKLVFYGGIDVQQLLSFATPDQVADEVRANLRAFARCGGYVVANSHHCIATIKGENVEAMCRAARD